MATTIFIPMDTSEKADIRVDICKALNTKTETLTCLQQLQKQQKIELHNEAVNMGIFLVVLLVSAALVVWAVSRI